MAGTNKYELGELEKGLAELELRDMHPLKVYRPTIYQQPIHESRAEELLVAGGKRCLPSWQPISDPLNKKAIPIGELGRPFFVDSRDPDTGQYRVGHAGRPFTKGQGDFYRFTLNNGESFDSTLGHQVLTTLGWISVFEAYELQRRYGRGLLLSMLEPGLSAFWRDAHDSSQISPDCLDGYWPGCRLCGEPLQSSGEGDRSSAPLRAGAPDSIHCCWSAGDRADKQEYSHAYQSYGHPSSLCAHGQTSGREDASLSPASCTTYSLASTDDKGACQSPQPSSYLPRRAAEADPHSSRTSTHTSFASSKEVSIVKVEYIGNYTIWDFEVEDEGNYELAGILHHNSGKTISAVMEVGSRILGVPITGHDNKPIKLRFHRPTKRNRLLFWVIGLNIDHIGQTIYHRLFSPGLGCEFKIIKDVATGKWRSYNEALDEDKEREEEAVLCPPMIGDNLIVPGSWHMESAAGHIFKSVQLTNGATICAYPSTGDRPKMGDAVHGIWIDEDIAVPHFIKEWQDRLITTNGWMIWSVWPQATNFALIDAMDRAEEKKDEEDPPIQCFMLEGSKNPYNSARGVQRGLDRMTDEEDLAHRDRGDIRGLMGGMSMYAYAPALHAVKSREIIGKPQNAHELISSLLHRYASLPREWTRYLCIDPSHTRTAALFGVVPPREWEGVDMGNRLIIERELIVKRHTPEAFADAIAPLMSGVNFEAFIMDFRAGRQTTIGNDQSVFWSYDRKFHVRGLFSRTTKSGFVGGCDDKNQRRRTVREFMEPIEDGWPKLMLVEHMTYGTQREFQKYTKKVVMVNGEKVITDDALNERSMDAMQCLEYLCEYVAGRFKAGDAYVAPNLGTSKGSPAYQAAMLMITKNNQTSGYVNLGPGAAA